MFYRICAAFCLGALLLAAAACGDKEAPAASAAADAAPAGRELKVGVCAGPYRPLTEDLIAPLLKAQGIKVTTVEFTDYLQPDLALAGGDLDANLFQHQAYLDAIVENQHLPIKAVINVPTLGMGVFSEKVSTLEELKALPPGQQVGLPNDAVNLARALRLIRDLGLITLKEDKSDLKASLGDIADNPLDLKFTALEPAQLPRTLDSLTLALVPGNYAYAAGLDYAKALGVEQVAEDIKNVIAVRSDDDKTAALFLQAVKSEAFVRALEADPRFDAFTRPAWWPHEEAE